MAIRTAEMKNALASAYAAAATHGYCATADPGATTTVANEVAGGSYARKPLTWSAPSNGTITASATFDIPAGVTVAWTGVANGLTGTNNRDTFDNTDQPFAGAGQLVVNFSHTVS